MVHLAKAPEELTFTTDGEAGNCRLYVRRNALPTSEKFDFSSALPGANQTINLDENVAAGTYYVMLSSPDGYDDLVLQVNGTQ